MKGTLYVVATPIGNLQEMTPRAITTLSEADLAAAEDTRHSRALFSHFGIKTPLYSCHTFNEEKQGDFFIRALECGQTVALISDAGTPCISDPGYKLIRKAADAGISVNPVCGASAVVAAMSVSGFDATRFAFVGFFPRKKTEQLAMLADITTWAHPAVFYESPKRITATLAFLEENAPTAQLCLCNDLTKKFERTYRGTPTQVCALLNENPAAQKGEYTCVIVPPPLQTEAPPQDELSLEAQLIDIMVKQGCDLKNASAQLRAMPERRKKKDIYNAALRLKELLILP
ncbi:MAG: 16S rRNA (cytidine(1402)-2'-O)-methyltransferase [Defluviitaleaceae bacterium]|nr:16S rRNA (cytidine(1402)-2'-O)-methyltransferase [Defluviitaleaceae bacterium]MCL2275692.1 16S rRNA (cytidine(1402)-2'-O)-methyltransferase [Defluviitaleaceae bacterium]